MGRRVTGVFVSIAGLAIAAYSVPFVTWVAFAVFVVGLSVTIVGVRMGIARRADER